MDKTAPEPQKESLYQAAIPGHELPKPPHAEAEFSHSEINANGMLEIGDYKERDIIFSEILHTYGNDSRVHKKVDNLRTNYEPPVVTASNMDRLGAFSRQFALLSADDEKELFTILERGLEVYAAGQQTDREAALLDCAAAYRILHYTNLRLIFTCARPFMTISKLTPSDIIQEGNIGLMKAICRFDTSKGNKFSTFAVWWIKQSMQRAVANQGRTIRLPVHVQEAMITINKCFEKFQQEKKRPPTDEEIAKYVGLSLKTVQEYQQAAAIRVSSLDATINEDADAAFVDFVIDSETTAQDDLVEKVTTEEQVAAIFAENTLDDQEKLILGLLFGVTQRLPSNLHIVIGEEVIDHAAVLGGIAPQSELRPKEIAAMLGITPKEVSSIRAKALRKLQRRLTS